MPLQKQDAGGNEQKETLLQLLVKNVLKNPYIWGMALTYFFIYVVRQGVTSWFVFYLMKVPLPHFFLATSKVVEKILQNLKKLRVVSPTYCYTGGLLHITYLKQGLIID